VCENTEDKVFLLSYAEATNSAYGFAASYSAYDTVRRMQTSDYSRATGANTSSVTGYSGCGTWWLRSPNAYASGTARYIMANGSGTNYSVYNSNSYGVVPALQIRLQ